MARNRDRNNRRKRRRKKHPIRKFLAFIIVLALVLLAAATVFLGLKMENLNNYELNTSALDANEDLSDYRNIVVLGVDTRDMNNFAGSRTDSIIIVSINEKTNDINLISVYRDSLLDIKDVGNDKVTHAFAYGGPERTINTLNRNLDLNITEYAALNFRTVQKVVDGVGGVDIDIQEDEIDQMNTFLPETARYLKCDYEAITHSGKQHLDGVQAVTYSRIRHTEGGDYRRTERMRTVLTAVFKEVKHTGPAQLNAMMDDVMSEISTNMTAKDIIPLMYRLPFLNINDSIGWPYDKEGWISPATGTWYAAPITLESNVRKLHKEVFYQDDYEPSDEIRNISANIAATTGYYGN